jgi:hypothetical protein
MLFPGMTQSRVRNECFFVRLSRLPWAGVWVSGVGYELVEGGGEFVFGVWFDVSGGELEREGRVSWEIGKRFR